LLHKKAKKTDWISDAPFGGLKPIISDRCKELFERGNVAKGIEFLPTKLHQKSGNDERYWFMNPFLDGFETLDLEQSEIYLLTDSNSAVPLKRIEASSDRELRQVFSNNRRDLVEAAGKVFRPIVITKFSFRDNIEYDLFYLDRIRNGGLAFFVSDRMKEAIQKEGISGARFTDINGD
jgi:hypothetical protein